MAAPIQAGKHQGPEDPPMSAAAMKYLLARPRVPAPLDPNFAPVILGKKNYLEAAKDLGSSGGAAQPLVFRMGERGTTIRNYPVHQ